MPIQVVCPCGSRLNAPDSAAGKKVSCPKCKSGLAVPCAESPLNFDEPEELLEERPARRRHQERTGATDLSWGITALVLGFVGLLTSLVPYVGIAVSGLGLLVGVIGVIRLVAGRAGGTGFVVGGLGLSIIAMATTFLAQDMLTEILRKIPTSNTERRSLREP